MEEKLVQITFSTKKLQILCTSEKPAKTGLREKQIKILHQRIMEIKAADSLADLYILRTLHCHELKGKLKGQYAVNLDAKYRIVFIIADDPIPKLPDGGVNRELVKEIEIVFVGDYH